MHLADPVFPPLLSGFDVRAPARPFTEALAGAQAGRYGAGDVVWARNTRIVDVAVILEPDVERSRTYEILCAGAVAVSDALGAIAPPEVAITWNWPHILMANKARVGQLRFELSAEDGPDGAPLWLVLGLELAVNPNPDGPEPGLYVGTTTLFDEGCIELDRTRIIEAWARHFLTWLNTWGDDGFKPVHEAYLFRANGYREEIRMTIGDRNLTGTFVGLDDHGHMLLKTADGVEMLHMRQAPRRRRGQGLPPRASPRTSRSRRSQGSRRRSGR